MLSRLRKISRRIGSEIGGLMATGKSAKGSTNGKAAAKAPGKSPAKPAAKAGKSAKSAKSVKPAAPKAVAKVALKSAKSAPKATAKPASKAASKLESKATSKPVAKAAPEKPLAGKPGKAESKLAAANAPAAKVAAVRAPKKADAVPLKATGKPTKPSSAVDELDAVLLDNDFAAEEQFAADIASDMEAAESETAEAEPVSPSAALLAVMKPTVSDEKAAEKKKKKDDLKIDRNGDMEAQWQSLKDKNKAIKPLNYKMSESFEARTPILHKVLGWGFIISNQNDRLEVLFQQGIKFLISNYKA